MTYNKEWYWERRRKGVCTTPLCKRKATAKKAKCKKHRKAYNAYLNSYYRRVKKRTRAEYLAQTEERSDNARHRSRYTDEALAAIPVCKCGIRHKDCDIEQRREDIRTSGSGGWW